MRSTLVREKMRSLVVSSQKRARFNKRAEERGLLAMASAIEPMEKRILYTTAFPTWTFETHSYAGGPGANTATPVIAADIGSGSLIGKHVGASTYSTVSGNGSAISESANTWASGDYWQFTTDSITKTVNTLTFDQTGSSTGPKDFKVQYSTDGTTYTDLPGGAYSVAVSTWNTSTVQTTGFRFSYSLSGITALSNAASIGFRLTNSDGVSIGNGTTAAGGTDRIDNVTLSGTYSAPGTPTIGSVIVSPTTVGISPGTAGVTLTATGVGESVGTTTFGNIKFYQEGNAGVEAPGTDTLIGTGTQIGTSANYSIGISSATTSTFALGNYTYYGQVTDSASSVANSSAGATTGTGGNTLTVSALPNVNFSVSSYAVNETAGTELITVTLGTASSTSTTVNYNTSDGVRFSGTSTNVEGAALNGRDYTSASGTLTFAAGVTSQTFSVPITSTVKTFAGTRSFNVNLMSPTNSLLGNISTAAVVITDNAVSVAAGTDTPTSQPTYTSAPNVTSSTLDAGSFLPLSYSSSNGFGSGTNIGPNLDFLEFGPSAAIFPTSYAVANVDSIDLSLYNSAISGSFGGQPGTFDLYMLTSTSPTLAAPTILYSANGSSGAAAIGGTGNAATLIGTDVFTNNVVGFNDFIFDLPSAVQVSLASSINAGTPIRFVIVPDASTPRAAADWEGFSTGSFASESPQLTALVEKSTTPLETFNLTSSADLVNKGATDTITVTRTASNGDLSDTPSISYSIANVSGAVLGTDFGYSATNAATGTLTFAAGASTTSVVFTIPQTALSADKQFSFTVSSPSVTGRIARLSSPTVDTVTIHDGRTENITANADNLATVGTARNASNGGVDLQSSTGFLDVAGTGTGSTNQSFGVLDYNTPGAGNQYVLDSGVVDSIQSISFATVVDNFHLVSGPLNAYLVSDSTTDISLANATTSPLAFNTSATNGGLGVQLGANYSLGVINFSASQLASNFVSVPLTGASPSTLLMLLIDLNKGMKFRIVLTPANTSVSAAYYGLAFSTVGGVPATNEAPMVGFNVVESPLPGWLKLGTGGVATFSESNETLSVTGGTANIVADPAAYGDGAVAITVSGSGTVLGTAFSTANNIIHVGSLSVTTGAITALGKIAGSDKNILVTPSLSIDSTSALDLGDGYLDVVGGSVSTLFSYIQHGFANGTWTGVGGIRSSAAAGTQLNSLGLRPATSSGTLDGASYAIGDALVKYTYYGDADLSGTVDGSDYSRIDSAFITQGSATPLSGWFNGDFNYDGVINGSDYTLIDNAFNSQAGNIAALIAAPAAEVAKTTFVTPPPTTSTAASFFSDKKVKESYADLVLGDLVTN